MTDETELTELLKRYKPHGVVKGGELLLPPNQALELADDLKNQGIAVMGCDGWYYLRPNDNKWIAQDLAVDFYVGDNILEGEDPVGKSIDMVKHFIEKGLPKRTAFISFTLDVPISWKISLD